MPNPREFIGANLGPRRGRRSYSKAENLNKGLSCEPIIFHRESKPKGKAGRPRKYKLETSKQYQDSSSISEVLDSPARSPSLSPDKIPCKRQRRLSKDDPDRVSRLTNQKFDNVNVKINSDEFLYKQSASQSPEQSMDEPIVKAKNFTCHQCGMQFKTKGRFDRHIPCRIHQDSEYSQKPRLKRGRKSLNSKSLNNMKLLPPTIHQTSVDNFDETSLVVRILGKPLKSDDCITYKDDDLTEGNYLNSSVQEPSITGILKFNLSPNNTVEFLICANKLAVKRCISSLDTNSIIDSISSSERMNICKAKENITELSSTSSSLPLTYPPTYYRSSDSVIVSSSSSSVYSSKHNQKIDTYRKDFNFTSHDVGLSSNPFEYHDRSQDELQAARTILSLAHGNSDMILNMGQIMMDLDNVPVVNSNSYESNTHNIDAVSNSSINESKISGDEVGQNSHWVSGKMVHSLQEDGVDDSSTTFTSSTTHPIKSINQSAILSDNGAVQEGISNDSDVCVSLGNTNIDNNDTNNTTIVITTSGNLTSTAVTVITTTSESPKSTTSIQSTSDTWHPVSSSQSNSNNNILQRKIRPPPKKRLSTNYSRSNSSRSFMDNTSPPTKLQDNTSQAKTSFSPPTTGCEQSIVPQPTKQMISISSASLCTSTDHVDTLTSFPFSFYSSPSAPTTSGVGLLPTPIQLTNVVYGSHSLISPHSTSLTPFISNQDLTSHHHNPMNAFAMVFPSPRTIAPTSPTMNGSQPPPSFFILPQLMVLPRFVGSYIPMISAPEPYPAIINPNPSSSLTETRSSTFMTSSLVTPIPTAQPEFSTNQPVRTIILQPPSTQIFGIDTSATVTQSSDDSHLKPISNLNDEVKEANTVDFNVLSLQQSDTSLCSVKDKILPPTVTTLSSPIYSKKSEFTKCIWSGLNTTKPVPIRPVPEASKVKPYNVLPSTENKSLQEQQQHSLTGQQNGSDQKISSISVSSHDMTSSCTKTSIGKTTSVTNSTTTATFYVNPPVHPALPSSGNVISPGKTVGAEASVDTKQSYNGSQQQQQTKHKLVTILPANQSERIKFQYRPAHHKRKLNFSRFNGNHKKCISTSHNLQRPNTSPHGKYRCQEVNTLHTVKSYHLKKHWRLQTYNRPYICHNCDVSFKTRGNLSKHMKSRCHHDRFLKNSGFTQIPLGSNGSNYHTVNQDGESQSKSLSHDTEDNIRRKYSNGNTISVSEDCLDYSKPSTISPKSSPPTLSCKTRNSTGAVNRPVAMANNKRNQDKSPVKSNCSGISSRSTSVSSTTQSNLSLKSTVLQSNTTCSHVMDSYNRIPAPNVNAVNLSQDLPMNLSAKPQEPIALIRYVIEPTVYAKINGIQSSCLNHSDNLCDKQLSSNCLSSAEVIVQTAVEAARSLASDRPNLRQTDKFSHSTSDSKYIEGSSTPGCLCDHMKQNDVLTTNLNTCDCEEQHFSRVPPTSTLSHHESEQNEKSCLLPRSSSGVGISCTEDSSLNKLNNDVKQNNGKSSVTPTVVSNRTESDTRQSHGTKSHTYLKDPRPYKCKMCHVGFRVSGHLYKHYRSKSHMSNILQMTHLSNTIIERVLQNHMGNPQLVNPDTGELSMRILEKIIPACESPTVTPVTSGSNGRN
ncbi:unnamed protein product [Heterobilharzia americana]|nr:unnamed protein product [Heterobilharzia americana]